jgi:hypothetical protein
VKSSVFSWQLSQVTRSGRLFERSTILFMKVLAAS